MSDKQGDIFHFLDRGDYPISIKFDTYFLWNANKWFYHWEGPTLVLKPEKGTARKPWFLQRQDWVKEDYENNCLVIDTIAERPSLGAFKDKG